MNRDYLLEQFRLIEEYTGRVRSIATRSRDDFLTDKFIIDAAVRELVVLFETSHNIAKHLIASRGWKEAGSKAEAFEILAEEDVLSHELSAAFREASRFRNLVTYQTTMVDDKLVYEIVVNHVGDFEAFAAQVAGWIEKNIEGDEPTS